LIAETAICVVDDKGGIRLQTTVATDAQAIMQALKAFFHDCGALGLHPELVTIELPAVCLETHHVRAAMSTQRYKTDSADALGIAHITRTGWFKYSSRASHAIECVLFPTQRRILKRKFIDLANWRAKGVWHSA
jgi:transposase